MDKPHEVFGVSDPCGRIEDVLARVLGAAQEIQQAPGLMERAYRT